MTKTQKAKDNIRKQIWAESNGSPYVILAMEYKKGPGTGPHTAVLRAAKGWATNEIARRNHIHGMTHLI